MPWWTRTFAKVVGSIFDFIPWPLRRAVSWSLAVLWFDILRFRRYTLLRNLTIAFPEKTKEERVKIARLSLVHLSLNLFEFLSLPVKDSKFANESVIFHGLDNFESAFAKNKGILFLSLHIGNGDFGCAMMSLRGIKLHLISKKFKLAFINNFWFGMREAMGTRFIDPHGPRNAFEILGACRKNEGVCFVLDQFMGKPFGIETRFFGKKTGTAYGLALFAIKTGAPVVPIYTYRDKNDQTHVVFDPVIPAVTLPEGKDMVDSMDRDLQIQRTTQQYNNWIQSVVSRFPEQWMWIHRRWKKWE